MRVRAAMQEADAALPDKRCVSTWRGLFPLTRSPLTGRRSQTATFVDLALSGSATFAKGQKNAGIACESRASVLRLEGYCIGQ